MVYRDISIVIRERFPTLETCVTAGEKEIFINLIICLRIFNCWWIEKIPWNRISISSILDSNCMGYEWIEKSLSRRKNSFSSSTSRSTRCEFIIEIHWIILYVKRVLAFRGNLGTLLGYDWVPIPLLYSQVVSLSVRIYFIIGLLGRQNLQQAVDNKYIDPVCSSLLRL